MRTTGYFNWRLAAVLVLGMVLVGTTAVALRQIQKAGRGQAALQAGKAAYEKGDWAQAAANLGRYLSAHQDDIEAMMMYADAQLQLRPQKPGNLQQAIAALRNVLRVDKTNQQAARRLIEIYIAGGAAGEAELTARTFLRDNPGPHPQIQLMLGAAMMQLGRTSDAIQQWMEILAQSPQYIEAYEAIGTLAQQRPSDVNAPAEYWVNLAVQRNPGSALARLARAALYARLGRTADAQKDLDAVATMDINDVETRVRFARQLMDIGQLDQAQAQIQQAAKDAPGEPSVWHTWAQIALRSGSAERMAEVADNGLISLKGRRWDFLAQAAELFIQAGRLDKGLECIEQLKKNDIMPAAAAFLEGLLEARRNRLPQAIACWDRAMALGFRSPQIRMLLASAYSQQGDIASAVDQLQVLCSEEPNNAAAHLALARQLMLTADWAGARLRTQAAIKIAPGNIEARLLDLEAQIRQLAAEGRSGSDPEWARIGSILDSMESIEQLGNRPLYLRLQAAMARADLAGAKAIIDRIRPLSDQDRLRIALASAELLVAEGDLQQATSLLERTIDQFPAAPDPVRVLAALYMQQGQQARCEQILKAGLSRMQQGPARRELVLTLSAMYDRQGHSDQSILLLQEVAKEEPNAIWPRKRLLTYQDVLIDTDRAQTIVDQIKAIEGQAGWQWRIGQARVWLASKDFSRYYPELVRLLRESLASRSNDVESLVLLAATYERAGEMQLAISTYRQALGQRPQDVGIVVATVAALYKVGLYDQADTILQAAAARRLAHPALDDLRFQGMLRQGQLDQASDFAQQIWKADPNNLRAGLALALLRIQSGDLDQARSLLEQIVAADPNSIRATAGLADVYLRQGRQQEALKVCDGLVQRRGDAASLVLRSGVLNNMGRPEQAEEDLDRAIQIEPSNPDVCLARAQFFRARGQLDRTLVELDRALGVAGGNPSVQALAVEVYMASGRLDYQAKARGIVEKALRERPDDLQMQIHKVRILRADRTATSDAQAQQVLQELITRSPRLRQPWVLLADLLLDQSNPGQAMDVILRGLAHHPMDRDLLMLKARAEAARSPLLAIQTLRGLVEQEPNNTDLVFQLAGLYSTSGEPSRAVELLEQHEKVCAPISRSRCRSALAIALSKAGRLRDADTILASLQQDPNNAALVLLTRARIDAERDANNIAALAKSWLAKHPNEVDTLGRLATELNRLGTPGARDAAIEVLGLALKARPGRTGLMMLLAQILQQSGRDSESADLYRQILLAEPNNVIAINNLAWILSESMGRPSEAIVLAEKGISLSPDYLDLLDTRGVIYYRLGRLDRAAEDLKKAVELYPLGHPAGVGARLHLARVYIKQKNRQEALRLLREALDLNERVNGLSAAELEEAKNLLSQMP